ncbi:MAG: AI-2E family transporter [Nanoarchaeota archaeon]|nr:AI-2E family transporter [Nanoarchaeota archaeon]
MKPKNKLFVLISVIALLLLLLYLSRDLYQILALSMIVAYFVQPLKKYLMKILNNESLVSVLCMIFGFSLLSVIIIVFVSSVYSSLVGIASFAAEAQNIKLINDTINLFDSYNINQPLTDAGLNQIVNIIQSLFFFTPQLAISIVIFMFFLFYFIKYGEEIINIIRGIVPPAEMKYFDKFIVRVNSIMRAIFRGQFITALVQSMILLFFLLFLGTPFAFELTFFTFLLCFFGITVSLVPLGLNIYYFYQGYVTGDYFIFIITVAFTIFITTIDNIIKPLIGERQANFNPVFFILGLTAGALTLGFTGFIIGPLLYGMFQSALEIYYEEDKIKFV